MVFPRIAFAVSVLGSLALPKLAHADRVKVAVVPGLAVNLDAARVDALTQDLADALSTALEVDATGGLDVRRELPAEGLPPDCVSTPACTADVARRTGAAQLLFVFMTDTGGDVQIDTTWVEPASGHQAPRPAIDLTSSTDTDAKAKFESVAHQLLPDAPVHVQPPPSGGLDTRMLAGTPRHLTTASLATGGGAIAALGVGIGFGLETRSKYNTCDAMAATCTSSQKTTIRRDGYIADASFLVATGAAIATAIMFATSGEEPRVMVAPAAQGVGASFVGRF
jgi:hypothetical protein